MSDLRKYFMANNHRVIRKWDHYFEVYERHFERFRNRKPVVLEIGVLHGGSIQMWKDYFGSGVRIIGIDINPNCKEFEEENVEIFIGSQSDRDFLQKVRNSIPPIDILIDDGGHHMKQQKVTFEEMFSHIKPDGVYLCEDLHSSYWLSHGGGHRKRGTFMEFTKRLIDFLHAYHSEDESLTVNNYTKSIGSIHYYDSIVVIEKQERNAPGEVESGILSIPVQDDEMSLRRRLKLKGSYILLKITNAIYRILK